MKWDMVRLGDIAETITKGTTPTTIGFDFVDKGINFIKIEAITNDGLFIKDIFKYISKNCHETMKRSQLKKNDILFSIAGALGRIAVVIDEVLPANINQALSIIRIPEGIAEYKYLFYALQTIEVSKQFENQKRGNSQLNISLDDVKNLAIPLPEISEQKRIVEYIETKLNAVDKIKKIVNEQIFYSERLFDSYVEEIYSNVKWEKVKLSDVSIINPSVKGKIPKNDNMNVSFVPMEAVDARYGKISISLSRELKDVKKGYTYFENNDVLFAKITPCMQNGKSAIAKNLENGIGFGSTEFHVIKPCENILPEWIHYFIRQKKYLNNAVNYMTGSVGQQRLPENFLRETIIPLPNLDEQIYLLSHLRNKFNSIWSILFIIENQSSYINALSSSILRKAFSGEL